MHHVSFWILFFSTFELEQKFICNKCNLEKKWKSPFAVSKKKDAIKRKGKESVLCILLLF